MEIRAPANLLDAQLSRLQKRARMILVSCSDGMRTPGLASFLSLLPFFDYRRHLPQSRFGFCHPHRRAGERHLRAPVAVIRHRVHRHRPQTRHPPPRQLVALLALLLFALAYPCPHPHLLAPSGSRAGKKRRRGRQYLFPRYKQSSPTDSRCPSMRDVTQPRYQQVSRALAACPPPPRRLVG